MVNNFHKSSVIQISFEFDQCELFQNNSAPITLSVLLFPGSVWLIWCLTSILVGDLWKVE